MAERIKLGINYQVGDSWVGGKYYLVNLVRALGNLNESEQPSIYLIASNRKIFKEFQRDTGYKYLTFFKAAKFFRWKEKLLSYFQDVTGINLSPKIIDVIYPNPSEYIVRISKKNLFWIPDFQEIYYPHFFSAENLKKRKEFVERIINQKYHLILSSESVKNDFLSLYPDSKIRLSVLPFAVSNISEIFLSQEQLSEKYGINDKYFALPNQLWIHKNHLLVFRAIKNLKERYPDIQVICTGKEFDSRDTEHPLKLKKFIKENYLEKNILMLGFIDRKDQLSILKNSIALIQPSLFEGWNTSIEEAKALNKYVIASDIDVHREQLDGIEAVFFKIDDEKTLIMELEKIWIYGVSPVVCDYGKNIIKFANHFLKIIKG